MPKLPKEHQFLDLSDYARPVAIFIAQSLKNTRITPIQVTLAFFVCGLLAIISILNASYWTALLLLVLKSILDAVDGELARVKEIPSHTGRYLDSLCDIFLNLLIFLSIWHVTEGSLLLALLAFLFLQLQGTLYHYYYVILRNKYDGDTTSRILEDKAPIAMTGEKQKVVNFLFRMYHVSYGVFDRTIYLLDPKAPNSKHLPKYLMTAVSTFGLGFQLLVIGLMMAFKFIAYVVPSFIGYSIFILIFIGLRRFLNR